MNLIQHLEKLEHFKLVAREGSFLGAAAKLGQSQPTLMYSINRLEEAIGEKLFFRSRQGTKLTKTGFRLLRLAEKIDRAVIEFESESSDESLASRELRLSGHNLFLTSIIVPILGDLKKSLDNTEVVLRSNPSTRQLVKWVTEGQVDLAIAAEPNLPAQLESIELVKESYAFFCSKRFYQSLKNKRLGSKDVNTLPLFYLPEAVAGFELSLKRILFEKKLVGVSNHEFEDFETVKAMAENDHGIAILPRTMVHPELKRKQLKEIPVKKELRNLAEISVRIVYRSDYPLIREREVLKEKVRNYFEKCTR